VIAVTGAAGADGGYALGNLIRFVLLPGQRHDSIDVEPLITGLDFAALIGDKAFDNNWLRANPHERGAAAVIPVNRLANLGLTHI
jgi:hypothetical protein